MKTTPAPMHIARMIYCVVVAAALALPAAAQNTKPKKSTAAKPAQNNGRTIVIEAYPHSDPNDNGAGPAQTKNLARHVLDKDELNARESGRAAKQTASRALNPDRSQAGTDSNGKPRKLKKDAETGLSHADRYRSKNAWKRNDFDGDGNPNIADLWPFDPARRW